VFRGSDRVLAAGYFPLYLLIWTHTGCFCVSGATSLTAGTFGGRQCSRSDGPPPNMRRHGGMEASVRGQIIGTGQWVTC
jgi:hypothetical protein